MKSKKLDEIKSKVSRDVEAVISIVESFEIDVKYANVHDPLLKCVWRSNSFQFNIRLFPEGILRNDFERRDSLPVICILFLKEKNEKVLTSIESFNIPNGHLIICDEDEDIQIFAKDIWNLLVALTRPDKFTKDC